MDRRITIGLLNTFNQFFNTFATKNSATHSQQSRL